MAIRKILKIGDETLRKHARPVAEVDRRTKQLLDDMAETMYAADGAGCLSSSIPKSFPPRASSARWKAA